MNSLIYTFKNNGEVSYQTKTSAMIEDSKGNQVQFNSGDTCIHISLKGTEDILTIENGFIAIGSNEDSPKIWCRYIKGTFYFCVWCIQKGSFVGFFGISRDVISKVPMTSRSFLKFMIENPDKAIDNYIRNTIFNMAIQRATKEDGFLVVIDNDITLYEV
jgi:hypothetical protein